MKPGPAPAGPANEDHATTTALEQAFKRLPGIRPLRELATLTGTLACADRLAIVDQALVLIQGFYAHLHMKRVRHAIDPVQALHLLRERAAHLPEHRFHAELLRIFKSLCDIHTAYTAPPPYARHAAFLPFLMEAGTAADGQRRYRVTRVLDGFDHPTFRPGVEIVDWHGAPVADAVARNALLEDGANPAAHRALGDLFMTVRWLGTSLVPDEHWVILGYRHAGGMAEIRLPWSLLALDDAEVRFGIQAVWLFAADTSGEESGQTLQLDRALNVRTHVEQVTRRHLFVDNKMEAPAPAIVSTLPDLFAGEVLRDAQSGERFGYLRLRAFEHPNVDEFVAEFRRLLGLMPRRGLILDLRGNPGGVVQCAESLLQFLTPKAITPLPFQFRDTILVDQLSQPPAKLPFAALLERRTIAKKWGQGIEVATATGAMFSTSAPLTSPEAANAHGQEYFGPVVLIIDALTYSAGDIFAAGFQDHGIGPVLGTDATTGAGGANVWLHEHLVELLPDVPEIRPLPEGAKLRVAARSCGRTGAFAGLPIEELGVSADHRHALTERDILENNVDLKACAMGLLAERAAVWLEADLRSTDKGQALEVKAHGIERIDLHLDGRPLGSWDLAGEKPLRVALPEAWPAQTVDVSGFNDGELVARRHLAIAATNPN